MAVDIDLRDSVNDSVALYASGTEGELTSALFGPDTPTFLTLMDVELSLFPELVDLPPGNYAFWAVMKDGRVLHAMRVSFPTVWNGLLAPFQVHELIRSGQISPHELVTEFEERGHLMSQLISVESHFRVESKEIMAESVGLPSYLGLTAFCRRTRRTGVLGHLNDISKKLFSDVGLHFEPVSTTYDLYTPALDDPRASDPDYSPTLLPIEGPNSEALKTYDAFVPRHIDTYIDLRQKPEPVAPLPKKARSLT